MKIEMQWMRRLQFSASVLTVSFTVGLHAQGRDFKNSVALSYSALGFSPNTSARGVEEYLGAGVEYRFMPKPWLGLQAQATKYPQTQALRDPISGGTVLLTNVDLLAGHRWKRVGVFGEVGAGRFHTGVFKGFNTQGGQLNVFFTTRNYPDLQTGGLVEVWLARRLSVTFEVRDNLLFIGPYEEVGPPDNLYPLPARTINAVEGRSGVAFHF